MVHVLNLQYLSKLILRKEEDLYINATVLKDIIPNYKYSILANGDTIFSSTTSNFYERIPLHLLPNNNSSYSCILSFGDHTIRQAFIIGDPAAIYKEMLLDSTLKNQKSLSPYFYRLNELMKIKNRDYWWQHKIGLLFEKINDPSYKNSSVSLHSFNSKVDNTEQYYIAIAPEKINYNKKYPVIIIFRPAFKYKTHLLTSIFLHKVWALKYLASLCNSNEFIVLISSNRSYQYEDLSPIGERDIVESLSDLKDKYSIDNNRIYLFGSCLGAKKALQFAERQNENYAGIALYNPALNPNSEFDFDRLRYIPIYLHHDIYDEHTPIVNSEKFIEEAKQSGVYIQSAFDNYFRNSYFHYFIDQDVFSFCDSIKMTNPYRKYPPGRNKITIKDFFADSFYVVYGTKEKSASIKDVAINLTKQWGDYYYSPCRLAADTSNVLKKDTVSNLLLIGNPGNNQIMDSLLEKEDLVNIDKKIKEIRNSNKNKNCTYEILFSYQNRMYLIIGTTGNGSIKYDFRYYPWFNADYQEKVSYCVYD